MLNHEQFKKAAKRLTHHFPDGKLTATQEILAESLGFRSYHALKSFYSEAVNSSINNGSNINNPNPIIGNRNQNKINLLKNLNAEQIYSVLIQFLSEGSTGLWHDKGTLLIKAISDLIFALHKFIGEDINLEKFESCLPLDRLRAIYEQFKSVPEFNKDAINSIEAYFQSLPGFKIAAPKQSETCYEQHTYCTMQISKGMELLKEVENNNILLASTKWIDSEYQLGNDDGFKVVWQKPITIYENFDDTWLADVNFRILTASLFKSKKIKEIYVSDLILNSSRVLNPKRKFMFIGVINNILSNYHYVQQYSKELQSITIIEQ